MVTSVIASSGHAATQRPQARHAAAKGVRAVLLSWCLAFNLPTIPRDRYSASVKVPSSNTEYGQTSTQSCLPSHRSRSTSGIQRPAGARQFSPGRLGFCAARRAFSGLFDPGGRSVARSRPSSAGTVRSSKRSRASHPDPPGPSRGLVPPEESPGRLRASMRLATARKRSPTSRTFAGSVRATSSRYVA